MKVYITGGCGFIGSHVADRLVERGDSVMVIDNFATGRRDNLTPGSRLDIIEGGIENEDLVSSTMNSFGPDLVIHAAASYKDPEDWSTDALVNVVGTANVVRAATRAQARRLIYFQTALCYGLAPPEQPVTLDSPLSPGASSYAVTKTAGEHLVQLGDIDHVSFRLANAYGPRNLSGPLPTFFHRLTTGKPCFVMDTRRDFVFISDLVECVMLAVDGAGHGLYHISSGSDVSIKELFDAVVAALGITLEDPVEVRQRAPDDAFTILLDPSRTSADFGWGVSTELSEGVKEAITYYQRFGISQTYTHLRHPRT